MGTSLSTYRLIAKLLSHLEASGFPTTPRQQLQLQTLLKKLPEDLPIEQLKTILTPLFATTPEEQALFYDLFDTCLAEMAAEDADLSTMAAEEEAAPEKSWWRLFLALVGLFLAFGVAIWFFLSSFEQSKTFNRQWLISPSEDITVFPLNLERNSTLQYLSFCDGQPQLVDSVFGNFFVEEEGQIRLLLNDGELGDTSMVLCVQAIYREVIDYYNVNLRVIQEIAAPVPELDTLQAIADSLYIEASGVPFPHNVAQYKIDEASSLRGALWETWGWPLKILLSAFIGLILWVLLRYRSKRKAKLVAQIVARDQPPYVWNIRFDENIPLDMGEPVQVTLNQLRRRQEADVRVLDVHKTVQSTIDQAGRISLQYQQLTRPPEYLVLIDRNSAADHRAILFDQLYQNFKANEVIIDRFFFDGDPSVCFNDFYPDGIWVGDLQQQFANTRLLIIGSGYHLLNPLNNKLSKKSSVFDRWSDKALLTTIPPQKWGGRESTLSEYFHLAPASIAGLQSILDRFELGQKTDFRGVWQHFAASHPQPISLDGDLVSSLQRYYSVPMLRWIAACAIYPVLHWDLTIQLGFHIEENFAEGTTLLTLEKMQSLLRLPWFVEGSIPDIARNDLLEFLKQEKLEQPLRAHLDRLLQQASAPASETAAFDEYQLNIIANQLLIEQKSDHKEQLESQFRDYLAAGFEPDFVMFKYLDRPQQPIDYLVPDSWKPFIYPEGKPFFGWKDGIWATGIWALLTLSLFGLLNPSFKACEGQIVPYKDMQLCLSTPAEEIIFAEQLARDAISAERLDLVDSIIFQSIDSTIAPLQFDTLKMNIAAAAFEKGAILVNQLIDEEIGGTTSKRADFRRSLVNKIVQDPVGCPYFVLAYELDREMEAHALRYSICQYPASFIQSIVPPTTRDQGVPSTTDSNNPIENELLNDKSGRIPKGNIPSDYEASQALRNPIRPRPIALPGGTFQMGCLLNQSECLDDELPVHIKQVNDFYMSPYEVTNREFVRFLNDIGNQSEGGNDWYDLESADARIRYDADSNFVVVAGFEQHPVTLVSWYGANAYCNWLNEKIPGRNYRLPTEAEWEFAARASSADFAFSGGDVIDQLGWYEGNAGNTTHIVGQKNPNAYGLYDMSGNVGEWVEDCFHTNYRQAPNTQEAWLSGNGGDCNRRRVRGGAFNLSDYNCYVHYRGLGVARGRYNNFGFRIAADL